jgi:polyribonucleotide nucleotidyltransferase
MIGLSDKNAKDIIPLKKSYSIAGKQISFEAGKLALLANGAVSLSDTEGNVLLVTAGVKEDGLNEKADFFPLVVDYQEKYYATGKIWGNRFMKREARPTDAATLISRLIDRPIRPMFPKGVVNDTQIIASVLSSDNSRELGSWGITGASLALLQTGAPFEGPVAGVKLSLGQDQNFIYEPSFQEEEAALLTLIVAGTLDAITMVEADGKEVSEAEMLKTLEKAHEIIKEICNAQLDFMKVFETQFGIATPKIVYNLPDETLYDIVSDFLSEEKLEVLYNTGKKEFQHALDTLDVEVKSFLLEAGHVAEDTDMSFVGEMVYKRVKKVMRKNVLEKSKRLDGRALDEVRYVQCETGLLPRTHGSGLFQRGMTQVLSVATLGGPEDEQIMDGMHEETQKRYIHHYNFPPFSVGEVRMLRGVGRREIGHGRLAEKALESVLPTEAEFPYVVRVVSETTTCNGSSSMGAVSGSTLALMNAGVPLKNPVSWVAMGMIYDEDTGNYKILSDIQAQ